MLDDIQNQLNYVKDTLLTPLSGCRKALSGGFDLDNIMLSHRENHHIEFDKVGAFETIYFKICF